jgi:hypothetical protein
MKGIWRLGYSWIFGLITFIGSLIGTLTWFIHYIAPLANTPTQLQAVSPIDLAVTTATLGGLVLIGAFYKEGNISDKDQRNAALLKTVGKLILTSSVCFIITYFLVEYLSEIKEVNNAWDWFIEIITDIIAFAAGITISVALSLLVAVLPFI